MEFSENMSEPVIEELIQRITALENENKKMKEEFTAKVQQIISWHVHVPQTTVNWNLPEEMVKAQVQKITDKLEAMKKEKSKTASFKEVVPKPKDEFSFKLTEVEPVEK